MWFNIIAQFEPSILIFFQYSIVHTREIRAAVTAAPPALRTAAPEHVHVTFEPSRTVLLCFALTANLRVESTVPHFPLRMAAGLAGLNPENVDTDSRVAQRYRVPPLIGQASSMVSITCFVKIVEVNGVPVTVAQHPPPLMPNTMLQSVDEVLSAWEAKTHENFFTDAAHFLAKGMSNLLK